MAKTFDPAERIRDKEVARQKDEEDLAAGRVTKEELTRRNAFIPSEWCREAKLVFGKRAFKLKASKTP